MPLLFISDGKSKYYQAKGLDDTVILLREQPPDGNAANVRINSFFSNVLFPASECPNSA
jgi:hypothetical protein